MRNLKAFFAAALLAAASGQASAGPGQQDWLVHTSSPMQGEYSAWGPGQQDWLVHTATSLNTVVTTTKRFV